ncbi:hypothetical protein ACLI09_06125 [Flavobacterium sp. RHBU_24]|uniref:hypothetical protein n=1 Tax=Flavobacterium sp. RHBU_24 TaxID=3391185 RepID=UPI0039853D13
MKNIGALLFFLAFFTMQGQGIAPKVVIDTISFKYDFVNVATYDVSYPQLRIEEHDYAASLINNDLKTYFATDTLSIYNAKIKDDFTLEQAIAERKAMTGEGKTLRPDEFLQDFEITCLEGNFISILVSKNVFPAGGRIMFESYGLQYNLLTGEKFIIDDFLSITNQQLTDAFVQHGYQLNYQDEGVVKGKIDGKGLELYEHISSLVSRDNTWMMDCADFYIKKDGNDIHLLLRLECAGPMPIDIGVSLDYLKPYIAYYEFKNKYKLWGADISQLIGKEISPSKTGSYIEFDKYTIKEGGGNILTQNKDNYSYVYSVLYWQSEANSYYVLARNKFRIGSFTVTDILTIPRADVLKYIVVDAYCEKGDGGDQEIIALVNDKDNPEYYTKIVKAWRANRNTGKFETVKPKQVKRCRNEGYGADED